MSNKRKHHGRKLSAHDVEVFKRTACELKGYNWIPLVALEYGVSVTTIHNILNERTHKDIEILPRETQWLK